MNLKKLIIINSIISMINHKGDKIIAYRQELRMKK